MIGDRAENEVCVYPDSGKIMVYNLGRLILREAESLNYFDGERTDEPPL